MERKRHFDIHFIGLKNMVHQFEYDVRPEFFGMYETSPIQTGHLTAKLSFDKKDSFFMLKFQVDGSVLIPCDRCNDSFDYELLCDFQVIVKFDETEENKSQEDDVIFISRNDSEMNVADIIYEYILINIPIQVFHPNDQDGRSTCNPLILEKLNAIQTQADDDLDPRWASLSKLKN